jgi:fatty-acyl-CoA synthase
MDIVGWLRSRAEAARRGARLVQATGVLRGFGPMTAVKMARDLLSGRRGAMAVIRYHAMVSPERPALVCGEQRYSYGELEERVYRLTHVLAGLGMRPGDRIGVFMHNNNAFLELAAAMPAVGGVAVQIGYRLKAPEVQYLLENSGAKALLFSPDLAPVVDETLKLMGGSIAKSACLSVGGHVDGYGDYETALAQHDGAQPEIISRTGSAGVMLYTSGTTGKSKGAARDFKKMGFVPVVSFISSLPMQRNERHLVLCPLYHSAAPAIAAMVMGFGGCIVIGPHFEPEEVLRIIEREHITSTLMVPTMLARICALPPETLRKYDTSSLRWVLSGAAPLPTETARKFEDAFGSILYNFYGATETGLVTVALPGEHTARPGTIGRAINGNEIRLLDGDGNDVPVGQVGEVFVRNEMMMDGYHGNDAATRAVMRDGFISVGDLGSFDADGYLYLADRKTDMIISGGVNIYPWEIEQRLHEHPAVMDAAVVGAPDPEWGEQVVAFVVKKPGTSPSNDELSEFVRAALADFKRPRRWFFVEELPRNATGKVLKRELKKRAQELMGGSS